MLKIIQAPSKLKGDNKIRIFLAGGISNCPNWQSEITNKFESENNAQTKKMLESVSIFNPRRKKMPDGKLKEQIIWEYEKLKISNIIVFWFSGGSLNPITLFEYGKYLPTSTKLVVGIDREYPRIDDVEIQTKIIRTSQQINYSIDELYNDLLDTIYLEIMAQNNL